MNLSQDIIYNMGISLGGLETATDYLYGNTDYYEPELTEIKSEIYHKEVVKPKREKVIKPEIDNKAIARKFNFIRNKVRERNDKVIFEKLYIDEDVEFEAIFEEDSGTEDILERVRKGIELVDKAEELMSDLEVESEENEFEDIDNIDIDLGDEDDDIEEESLAEEESLLEEEESLENEGGFEDEEDIFDEDNMNFEDEDEDDEDIYIDLEEEENDIEEDIENSEEYYEEELEDIEEEFGDSEDDGDEVLEEIESIANDNTSTENELNKEKVENVVNKIKVESSKVNISTEIKTENKEEKKEDGVNEQLEEYKRKIAELEAREKELEEKNKSNEYLKYSLLSIEDLYKEVKEFMLEQGVGKKAVEISKVNEKFGSQNIKKLIIKSYLIKIGKGVTVGR